MKKWSVWNVICISGVIWLFIAVTIGIYVKWQYYNYDRRLEFAINSIKDIEDIITVSFFFWCFVFLRNLTHLGDSKPIGLFTWLEKYKYEPPEISARQRRAQYPPVNDEFLSKRPEGLILGKYKNSFVTYPLTGLSAMIIGLPGSGKSTMLLSTLIYQLHHKHKNPKIKNTFFVLDVKPELMRKSSYPWAKNVRELSIQDRSKYGWNVYYNLSPKSTDDEILTELDVIARALIDAGKNEKNEFFYQSARTIFKFVCLADFKKGKSFIQSIDHLMESDLEKLVSKVLEQADGNFELMKVRKGLSSYKGKEGEAFQGIELAFRESLEIFQKDDTRIFFESSSFRKKVSPKTLENRINVFLTIKTTKLKENKTVVKLVVAQLIHALEDRDEDKAHYITLIIDEAYRVGLIKEWIDFMSVCRSKKVSVVLAFQSLSQIQSVCSKEDAETLVEMVGAICVLSCRSDVTTKMICNWAGEYYEESINTNCGGKNDGSYSRSYQQKKILQPADLMSLKKDGEAVLFLNGEYARVKVTGAQYFNIKELNEISKKCIKANNEYLKERK